MPEGSPHRAGYVLSGLGRFGRDQGWGQARPCGAEVVEAFVVGGPGRAGRRRPRAPTARCCARSGAGRPALATPFRGSAAKAPYSAEERAELLSVAASQRSAWRRGSALTLLALGIGAGLRPASWRPLSVTTSRQPRGVRAGRRRGPGAPCRCSGVYAKTLAQQAKQAGPGYLFCPGGADRSYKNFVNNFCYSLRGRPGCPEAFFAAGPFQFHLRPPGGGHTFAGTALYSRHLLRSSRCCVMPATSPGRQVPKPS